MDNEVSENIEKDLKEHKERQKKDKERLSKILDKTNFEVAKKEINEDSDGYSSLSNTPSPRNRVE